MNHLNNLISNPILIKQFTDYYTNVKSERSNQSRWERFIDVGRSGERKYRLKMRQLFDAQLDDIVRNLARNTYKADSPVRYVDENNLCDWNDYRIQYNEFGQLELPGIMSGWANLELEALEVGLSFDVVLPDVLTAITNRANLFSDAVINETRDALHKVIVDSINVGDGIPQLRRKIEGLYDNMSKARAIRIARTEMIWAQNEGAEQSYIQSGVVEFKEWWSARDERRCPFCASMHGRRLGLGGAWFNQGESLTLMVGDKPKTMQFNYENVRHPPLHCH
jgi:SPP1 gp7 family putative phage head morphogenesis protein